MLLTRRYERLLIHRLILVLREERAVETKLVVVDVYFSQAVLAEDVRNVINNNCIKDLDRRQAKLLPLCLQHSELLMIDYVVKLVDFEDVAFVE